VADGPYLLADLPAGSYQVSAGAGPQRKTQSVDIQPGAHKRLVFELTEAGH
jgi:hypothetical protein